MSMAQHPPASAPPQSRRRLPLRRGATLLEQIVVLTLLSVVLTLALMSGVAALDAVAVRVAAQTTTDLIAQARDHALAARVRTAVRFDVRASRIVVHAGVDTIGHSAFTDGVRLTATRDSLAYGANGLGHGAANLRITVTRGRSSDTITVSRLGRVLWR
jgi:type II secretory pathway pseudopilin PulG